LDFPVDNRLVIDKEPFLLPLLEHWYGTPSYLLALFDANEAHLFDVNSGGGPKPVDDLKRADLDQEIQYDKPRFNYKKRFTATWQERLHGEEDSPFLRELSDAIGKHWGEGHYAGLILFGHAHEFGALRRLLPKEIDARVLGAATHAVTRRPEDLTEVVSRLVQDREVEQDRQILADLNERWKENHLVANGPTEVLDALQQGRAVQILLGGRRDVPGARCTSCGYRFGAPVRACPYCQGTCATVNALQDILRLAARHRVDVHLFHVKPKHDPLDRVGGVAALVRASANWAPDSEAARGSKGHSEIVRE
jgi:hypothetical protein